MNNRMIKALALAGVALIGLSGCSSADDAKKEYKISEDKLTDGLARGENLSQIEPELFTETLTKAIEKQVGQRPDIDCGTEPIPLQAGSKVLCHLDDGGNIYEVEASVGNVSNIEDFGVTYRVAGEPGILRGSTVGPKEDGEMPSEIGKQVEESKGSNE